MRQVLAFPPSTFEPSDNTRTYHFNLINILKIQHFIMVNSQKYVKN